MDGGSDPRVRCERCHAEKLVAFSCKRRGFCPSCGARRMVESASLLVEEVLPREPLRQWVLSVLFALRFLLARQPTEIGSVLGIVYRAIATHLIKKARLTRATGQAGAVTLIQPKNGSWDRRKRTIHKSFNHLTLLMNSPFW